MKKIIVKIVILRQQGEQFIICPLRGRCKEVYFIFTHLENSKNYSLIKTN